MWLTGSYDLTDAAQNVDSIFNVVLQSGRHVVQPGGSGEQRGQHIVFNVSSPRKEKSPKFRVVLLNVYHFHIIKESK